MTSEAARTATGGGDDDEWLIAVRRSAQRVVEERRDIWNRYAISSEEAERLVAELLASLETVSSRTDRDRLGAEKALLQRMIDLIRQDLLESEKPLGSSDLVHALRQLESLRVRLEPSWKEALASQLMGASALDMVVEIAHDLRSPLTSVMFLAETLRKGQSGPINEIQRQQLGIIYSAAFGLSSMANDLMDSARETDPTEHAAEESFSISELVDSVRVMVAPMLEEKRLKLLFRTPDQDVRIGLPVPLGRVLLNLVTNAIKFTETGSVEILVEELQANRIEFAVADTGRGLDVDRITITELYEPFRRSKSRTGYHFSNTGLGLSICARMVNLMGGELQVEARQGGGTRFFFVLELPRASRI